MTQPPPRRRLIALTAISTVGILLTGSLAVAHQAVAPPPEPISLRYLWRNNQVFRYELKTVEERQATLHDAAATKEQREQGADEGLLFHEKVEAVYGLRFEVIVLRRKGAADLGVTIEYAEVKRRTPTGSTSATVDRGVVTYRTNGEVKRMPGLPRIWPRTPLRITVSAKGRVRILKNPWRPVMQRALGRDQTAASIVRALGENYTGFPDPLLLRGNLGTVRVDGAEQVTLPTLPGYPAEIELPIAVDWTSRISEVERKGRDKRVTLYGSAKLAPLKERDLMVPSRGGLTPGQIVRIERQSRTQSLETIFNLRTGRTESLVAEGTYEATVLLPLPGEKDFTKDKGFRLEAGRYQKMESRLLPRGARFQFSR